jgi:hypothetical protein
MPASIARFKPSRNEAPPGRTRSNRDASDEEALRRLAEAWSPDFPKTAEPDLTDAEEETKRRMEPFSRNALSTEGSDTR